MYRPLARLATQAVTLAACLGAPVVAHSQQDEDPVRKSVVIVVASGTDQTNSAKLESQGTGFFINRNGLIVTSYHLRSALGATVFPGSVEYEVHLDPFSPAIPATNVYSSEEADIMVLAAPLGDRSISALQPADRGSATIELARTPVYVASFAGGYGYSKTPSVITSWIAAIQPPVPGWTTGLNFAPGQSGSPVVLADGRVIAVVKASDAGGASLGIVVPIMYVPSQYWGMSAVTQADPTAARVRVSRPVVSRQTETVSRPIQFQRHPCDAQSQKTETVNPPAGWEIIPDSVSFEMVSFEGKSVTSGTGPISPSGFDVRVDMEPIGRCQTMFGFGLALGAAAKFEGRLTYKRQSVTPLTRDVVVADAAVMPGVQIPLSGDARNLSFAFQSPSGELTPFTPRRGEIQVRQGTRMLDIERSAISHQ